METRRYLWICSPVTRIPHIWWRLCRSSWFVLPCYGRYSEMFAAKLCCYLFCFSWTPNRHQVDPTAAVGSHTSKHLVEIQLLTLTDTNMQTCTSFVPVFLPGFEQCATAHIHRTQTTEHRVLCTLLLCSSCAAIRFVSNIHISLICIQGPSRCERFHP